MKPPWIAALLCVLASCTVADRILGDPPADDPMDGYDGYLGEAGTNSELDWGPQQQNLLDQYAVLRKEYQELQAQSSRQQETIEQLGARLETEESAKRKETNRRIQSEAAGTQVRREKRDLEARILTMSIRKAELEKEMLQLRIAQLKQSLQSMTVPLSTAETSATPGKGRL